MESYDGDVLWNQVEKEPRGRSILYIGMSSVVAYAVMRNAECKHSSNQIIVQFGASKCVII